MAANKTIGGINVAITATTQQFAKSISGAQRITKNFAGSLKGLVFNLKTLGAALAIGGVTKLVSDQMQAIATMKDLSDKTGISVEKLGGLELVAREAGISMSVMEKSLVKLNSEMGMQGDVALRAWIEKTAKLTTQQERLAEATRMFGVRGADMVRLVAGGVAAFDETQRAAERSGWAVSAATAMGVDRALESFDRLKDNVGGIFRTMAAESWPYLQVLVDGTQSLIDKAGGGKTVGTFIVDVLVEMAKNVADSVNWMAGQVVHGIGEVMRFFHEWRKTTPARTLGFGFATSQDRGRSFMSYAKMIGRGNEMLGNPPSAAIQSLVDAAKAAAAQAVKDAALTGPGLFDGMGEAIRKYGMGSMQSWMGAGQGLWGAASGGFMKMLMAPKSLAAAGQRPALAFAESGSVDSYRQQAAIRRQGDDIAKKQLSTQQKMEGHLSKLVGQFNFAPANISG